MGVSPGDFMGLRPLLDLALGASLGVKPGKVLFCSGPQALLLACHLHDVDWSPLSEGGAVGITTSERLIYPQDEAPPAQTLVQGQL